MLSSDGVGSHGQVRDLRRVTTQDTSGTLNVQPGDVLNEEQKS